MLSSEAVHCQINFTRCSDMIVHSLHIHSFLLCNFVTSWFSLPCQFVASPKWTFANLVNFAVLLCSYVGGVIYSVNFVIVCSLSLILLIPWEGYVLWMWNFFNIIIYMFSHMPHNATPDQCDAVGTLHFQKQLRKMDTIYRNFLLGLFL